MGREPAARRLLLKKTRAYVMYVEINADRANQIERYDNSGHARSKQCSTTCVSCGGTYSCARMRVRIVL